MFSSQLSRNQRLRKSKSAVSVKLRRQTPPSHDPLGPETAQLHAMTAASLAMQRAGNRSSVDTKRSPTSEATAFRQSFRSSGEGCTFSQDNCTVNRARNEDSTTASTAREETPTAAGGNVARQMEEESNFGIHLEEFGMLPEEKPPSLPSSYRKIKKAKSLFFPRLFTSTDPPDGSRHERSATGPLSRRTLRRSMSFFKPDTPPDMSPEALPNNYNEAIHLAREEFFKKQVQSGGKSSSDKRPRRHHKPLRKSVRSAYDGSNEISDNSSDIILNSQHQMSKPRRFSISLKKGLRRIFGRRFTDATPDIDQMEYNQCYPRGNPEILDESGSSEACSDYKNFCDQLRSQTNRSSSIRSMKTGSSLCTSNSRITSWTDSTATNTITMKQPPMNRAGLAIIQEDGASYQYTPTPSPGHRRDGYSIFRQPLQLEGAGDDLRNVVDSQRVYSALMRRIGESTKGSFNPGLRGNMEDVSCRRLSTSNCSPKSIRSIRHVTGASSTTYPTELTNARASPGAHSQVSVGLKRSLRLTPQQIARNNESHAGHSQSACGLPGSMKNSVIEQKEYQLIPARNRLESQTEDFNLHDDTNSIIISRTARSPRFPNSPSVYSRTTGAGSPLLVHTGKSYDSESENETGTVTILTSERLPYKSPQSHRSSETNFGGSGDWKNWMNSQLDLFDASTQGGPSIVASGHYRESAQLNDDSDDSKEKNAAFPDSITTEESIVSSEPIVGLTQAKTRSPLTELLSIPRSNFSRPLRLSPDGALSVCSTVVRKPSVSKAEVCQPCTPMICGTRMRSSPLASSPRAREVSKTPTTISPLVYSKKRAVEQMRQSSTPLSPLDLRNSISLRGRDLKENSPLHGGQLHTIRFNSVRSRPGNRDLTKENRRTGNINGNRRVEPAEYVPKPGDIGSSLSTKRMVDRFLSERSQRQGDPEDGQAEPAFL
ncbi:hypothetical protein FQN57_006579 [Myotisia sp. PD_48]|nr:hypothetical protein FQN57_006579 [Myotisia sp. PD_48]